MLPLAPHCPTAGSARSATNAHVAMRRRSAVGSCDADVQAPFQYTPPETTSGLRWHARPADSALNSPSAAAGRSRQCVGLSSRTLRSQPSKRSSSGLGPQAIRVRPSTQPDAHFLAERTTPGKPRRTCHPNTQAATNNKCLLPKDNTRRPTTPSLGGRASQVFDTASPTLDFRPDAPGQTARHDGDRLGTSGDIVGLIPRHGGLAGARGFPPRATCSPSDLTLTPRRDDRAMTRRPTACSIEG